MARFYSNNELASYERQLLNYDVAASVWARLVDAYKEAHQAWLTESTGPDGEPMPEPEQPDPELEPAAPDAPQVYESREVTEVETIQTATGPALIIPPRIVVTPPAPGTAFAISPEELDATFTSAEEPLPTR